MKKNYFEEMDFTKMQNEEIELYFEEMEEIEEGAEEEGWADELETEEGLYYYHYRMDY